MDLLLKWCDTLGSPSSWLDGQRLARNLNIELPEGQTPNSCLLPSADPNAEDLLL